MVKPPTKTAALDFIASIVVDAMNGDPKESARTTLDVECTTTDGRKTVLQLEAGRKECHATEGLPINVIFARVADASAANVARRELVARYGTHVRSVIRRVSDGTYVVLVNPSMAR